MPDTAQADDLSQVHGEADRWDRDAILLLALITLADTALVARFWDTLAPRRWRGLLLALSIDTRADLPDVPPRFWFDIQRQRYGTEDRGYIPDDAIRAAVIAVILSAQARATSLADQLIAGGMDIAEWQNAFAAQLKPLVIAFAAVGKGGVGRLAPDDLKELQDKLEFQYTRLGKFARQIEKKDARADTPEKISNRADLYPQVGYEIYQRALLVSHQAVGFDLYRNVLDMGAEHCVAVPGDPTPDCVSVTNEGLQKIGTLPDIGARLCRWNCRCHWSFERSTDG